MSDIFDEAELKADATTADGEPPAEEQPQDDRPRDEHGRFAPKQAEDEPPEGDDPDDPDKHKSGTVPQGALHAEREKRKASDGRAAKLEAELKTAQEKLDQIRKLKEQVASREPEPLPDVDDPAHTEHLRTRLAEVERNQTQIGQYLDNRELETRELQQLSEVMGRSEAQFRESHADYDEAIRYVVESRAKELALYGASQAEINATISQEASDIARMAIRQQRDPAEVGYEIARLRGYRAPEGQAQPGTAAATLDAIAAAQGSARSLSQAAGATPKQINAETIAAMSGEEFEALYATAEGRALIDNL